VSARGIHAERIERAVSGNNGAQLEDLLHAMTLALAGVNVADEWTRADAEGRERLSVNEMHAALERANPSPPQVQREMPEPPTLDKSFEKLSSLRAQALARGLVGIEGLRRHCGSMENEIAALEIIHAGCNLVDEWAAYDAAGLQPPPPAQLGKMLSALAAEEAETQRLRGQASTITAECQLLSRECEEILRNRTPEETAQIAQLLNLLGEIATESRRADRLSTLLLSAGNAMGVNLAALESVPPLEANPARQPDTMELRAFLALDHAARSKFVLHGGTVTDSK
jgi:hypothetical protein